MDADVPSAIAVVRCIMARCRLLGLDDPGVFGFEATKPQTVVVQPVA